MLAQPRNRSAVSQPVSNPFSAISHAVGHSHCLSLYRSHCLLICHSGLFVALSLTQSVTRHYHSHYLSLWTVGRSVCRSVTHNVCRSDGYSTTYSVGLPLTVFRSVTHTRLTHCLSVCHSHTVCRVPLTCCLSFCHSHTVCRSLTHTTCRSAT